MSTDQQVAAANPIEAVRARLDGGRAWIKNDWGSEGRPRCLNGAASECGVFADYFALVGGVVREQYAERLGCEETFHTLNFNNHPLTTWADVDLVLDKAAIKWDEQVR